MEKIRLGIIFGSRSGEHEVSLMSATSVIKAAQSLNKYEIVTIGISRSGVWRLYKGDPDRIEQDTWFDISEPFNPGDLKSVADFALPILHGPYGEDGTIQGLFEMLDIPYGGCGVLASSVAMDKGVAKDVYKTAGLPICRHILIYSEDFMDSREKILCDIEKSLGWPVFVKPANMGSSVGVTKAKDEAALEKAIMTAMEYDRRILIEEGLEVRELETSVIGNHNGNIEAAAVGEILPSDEFYDYHAKYQAGGASKLMIPADITVEQRENIKEMAKTAYKAVDCKGFARIDFFMDRNTNKIYINEINTIPGFTKFSMMPLLWAEAGVPYPELIDRIVGFGYERYYAKNRR